MQGYTDIRTGGLVALLPAGWRPYALLARLDRPIGSWLLFLPGLWAFAIAAPDWAEGLRLTLLFGIGAVAMRGAGCVVNDLWDRDIDRRVERTRVGSDRRGIHLKMRSDAKLLDHDLAGDAPKAASPRARRWPS